MIKDRHIVVRVDKKEKAELVNLAKTHNLTLTELLLKNVQSNIFKYQTIIK